MIVEENQNIKRWKFGIDNDKLVNLVLQGKKKATTSLLSDYDNNNDACLIQIKDVIITEFKNIKDELAYLEGEGDRSLEYYRKVHNDFFKSIDKNFNDNTKVVFEIFEVIK